MNFSAEQTADISGGWKDCYSDIPARNKTSLPLFKLPLAGDAGEEFTPST